MERFKKGSGLNIILLGLVSFANDIGSEMIVPILPMFISALGGTGLVIGVIGGIRDSVASILKVLAGFWADKTGKRKIFVSAGYLTSVIFKLLLVFSKIWQHVLLFAGLERVGKGLRTAPRDAIISESMPDKRGRGFGIHRSLDTSGAVIGSIVVFSLFWFFGFSFKSIILTAAGVSCLALLPLSFVKEPQKNPQKSISLAISLKKLPKSLKAFILVSVIFSLANFSYMFFILRAGDAFSGSKMSVGMPILLYVLFNIFYAAFSWPFGNLSDRIGRVKVLAFGYFLFSLVSLGFVFFHSIAGLVILFALYGVVFSIIDGNQRAFVSDLSHPDQQAVALGAFHTSIGLSALPAGLIAGYLWQHNPNITFLYGSGMAIIAALIFILFRDNFQGNLSRS